MNTITQKKICMLGDVSVGKTSLVRRYVEGIFDDRYLSTIGVKISRKEISLEDGTHIRFLVWDLAGGEKFTGIQTSYLHGAAGALLVCDLTRSKTFQYLKQYAERLREVSPNAPFIVIGNKADLIKDRDSDIKEFQTYVAELKAPYLVASAKTGENVESSFEVLAKEILTTP